MFNALDFGPYTLGAKICAIFFKIFKSVVVGSVIEHNRPMSFYNMHNAQEGEHCVF